MAQTPDPIPPSEIATQDDLTRLRTVIAALADAVEIISKYVVFHNESELLAVRDGVAGAR